MIPGPCVIRRESFACHRIASRRLAHHGSLALALLLALAPHHVRAQQAAAPAKQAEPAQTKSTTGEDDDAAEDEIVVTGQPMRGAAITKVPPVVTINATTIRALGAFDLREVFQAIAPEIGNGRDEPGRNDAARNEPTRNDAARSDSGQQTSTPVVLVNGQRIADFASIREFPPETVSRIEVFPEKVALEYGYGPDRRVVNVVLRSDYRALTLLGRFTAAPGNGRSIYRGKVNLVRIHANSYWALGADLVHQSPAYAATTLGTPGSTASVPDHTLLAQDDHLTLNAASTSEIGKTSAQFTARLDLDSLQSRPGLSVEDGALLAGQGAANLIAGPLYRRDQMVEAQTNATLNGKVGDWRWSFVGNLDEMTHVIHTTPAEGGDGFASFLLPSPGLLGSRCGMNDASCVSTTTRVASADTFFNGNLFVLPAGPVTSALRAGVSLTDLDSASLIDADRNRLQRGQESASVNLNAPLTSRGSALGAISLGLNGGVDGLSDFGALPTIGSTLEWSPVRPIDFLATFNHSRQAPTLLQLGEATLDTPDLRQFDFVTDTTTIVRQSTGGNGGLRAQTSDIASARLQVTPFRARDLTFSGEYSRERIHDPFAIVSAATAATLAALPQNFTRSATGYLAAVNLNPINFDHRDRQQLRFGLTFSTAFGATPPPGSRRPQRNQFQIALYDTWRLQDAIVLRSGQARLNLLDHDIIGNTGGTPDHEIELQTSLATRYWSLNLNADWQTPTSAYAGATRQDKLTFTQGILLAARLQINLTEQHWLVRRLPFLRGNLNLSAENLLGAHLRVRDANGTVPLAYSDDYLRPAGQTFRITLRKRFR